jgi:hypothetical protein
MKRTLRLLLVAALLGAAASVSAGGGAAATSGAPRWLRHVRNYPGGLSGAVRATASPKLAQARRALASASAQPAQGSEAGNNVQMNEDTRPPMPQNETAVDYNPANPLIAVAASNDYVAGGLAIMRTSDGGRTWGTTFVNPQFTPTRDFCTGGDPSVAYSVRDHAFYASQLCFFRALPFSEIHLFKSVDNGKTWTPGRLAAVAATNSTVDPDTGEVSVDESLFYDKEYIAIDNNRSSPHFGRIYMTYVKFHIRPNGFSDYCPTQLAYTDQVPTENPQLSQWNHTKVVPDAPGSGGRGPSANQWAYPQVESDGDLDVTYVLENCNTGFDQHLEFRKSTNGGAGFSAPVQIDHPGEFRDNPNVDDLLPNKDFRAPISPSFDVNKKTGTLAYVYQNNLDRATSGANISLNMSHDGGKHWTHMKYISTRPGGGPARRDQYFPWIDSDQSGNWYAIFFDNRLDPHNKLINTFQADSHDQGGTWPNRRISTESWNPDFGFRDCGCFIGDYNGIAASDKVVYPVWTDGRNTNFPVNGFGETDIFTNVEIRG